MNSSLTLEHYEKLESYLPVSLLDPLNFVLAFFIVLFFVVFRYFLMVYPFHFLFYQLRPAWSKRRQIYPELPGSKEQWFEIKWSLWTSLIFALAGVVMGVFWELGWTQIFLKFDQYGLWYLPVSWVLILLLHETYFYWTHRWLHLPKIYEKYHSIHHKSLRPSPWASFSFHPVESVINAAFVPLVILLVPTHPLVIIFHLTFMTISAITNHSGFEVLPANAVKQGWGKLLVSGVHHTTHHRFFRNNYGLFFTFWDQWMGTEKASFEADYNRVFSNKSP